MSIERSFMATFAECGHADYDGRYLLVKSCVERPEPRTCAKKTRKITQSDVGQGIMEYRGGHEVAMRSRRCVRKMKLP